MSDQLGSGFKAQPLYNKDKKSRLTLDNYNGPYDKRALRKTCYDLVTYMDRMKNSQVWCNINKKTSICGFLYSSKSEDGYGESSTTFSHAGIPGCEYNHDSSDAHHTENVPSTSVSHTIDDLSSVTNFSDDREIIDHSKDDSVTENTPNENTESSSNGNFIGNSSTRRLKVSERIDNPIPASIPSVSVTRKSDNDETTGPMLQERKPDECPDEKHTKLTAMSCEKMVATKKTTLKRIETTEDEIHASGKDVIYINDSDEEAEPILIEENERSDSSVARDSNVDNDVIIIGVSSKADPKTTLNVNVSGNNNFNSCDNSLSKTAESINSHSTGSSFIDLSKFVDTDPEDELEVISNSSLKEVYQCEFCLNVTEHENEMRAHLSQELHSSASLVLATPEKTVVYLCRPSVLQFKNAIFKKVAAICPENDCSCLFSSVGACESHVTLCHAQGKAGGYSLADIIDCKSLSVSASDNICDECGFIFKKLKSLESHYQITNHQPFVVNQDGDTYIVCDYCHSVFLKFKDAVQHVRIHTNLIVGGKLNLLVLTVSQEKRMMKFPPYTKDKQGEYNYLSSKIRNLKENKKMCGKSGRRRNQRAIKKLKGLLKIVAKS